ncbi:MAG TPA: ribonuclease H-like domain-containing protein [Dehalococcoidia bacterium]|nr:ribonuclease H-like domain-containing protein [Dehalococcoidia bacterium]
MTLRDRLVRLRETPPVAVAPPAPPQRAQPDLTRWVPGWEYAGPSGTCFVGEQEFPVETRHGHYRLGALLRAEGWLFGYLGGDPAFDEIDLDRTAFLDTETTGLAGGTGTFAFLVGVGYYAAGPEGPRSRFVVRQYLMRDPGEEPALLDALADLLAGFSAVITFNGRAFDWPLIETRYRLSRRRLPLADPLHLDLLFPARRVWRHRLESCALKDLEPPVLGVRRRDDVPGWLIPGLYFQFQRDRDPRPLAPVFSHNLLDILSLTTLAARLATVVADPAKIDPADAYGAGRLYEARGRLDRAIACYETALEAGLPAVLRQRCTRRLSILYKRDRQWPAAVALWERCCAEPEADLFGHLELAKYYEHVARDLRRAVKVVDQALLMLEVGSLTAGRPAGLRREWEQRRRRVQLKLRGRA